MTNCEICSTLAAEDVQQEIAAAVAAEREACARAVHSLCGEDDWEGYWKGWTEAIDMAVDTIRDRTGEGEQVPMSDNPNCET